jgi:hypothetical protein
VSSFEFEISLSSKIEVPFMAEALKFTVMEGAGKLPKEKKAREWAQVLCSQSGGGCGTVFWAERSSFYEVKPDLGGLEERETGRFTACVKCGANAGGTNVKFVKMDKPDVAGRPKCVTCRTNHQSLQCEACVVTNHVRASSVSSEF